VKIIACCLLSLFITGTILAQYNSQDSTIVFTKVEKQAQFPDGDSALRNYLDKNINPLVPINNNAPVGIYTIMVMFIVRYDGSINDVRVETHLGYGMEEEAIRVIKNSPKGIPAFQI
jgi:protein TonB